MYDKNADNESEVKRTKILLKRYFDSDPVTRSQAKMLCGHMDHFREVTLDFTGLNWIGQGFAHQLFVVFHNEHPDIRIKPIEMSEDIEKMVRHVIQT